MADIISKEEFTKVLKQTKSIESKLAEGRGNMGDLIAKAVDEKNLHKKAFTLSRQCSRMDPAKLLAFLEHFDIYREYAGLDDLAGSSLDLDAEPDIGQQVAKAKMAGKRRSKKRKGDDEFTIGNDQVANGGGDNVTPLAQRRAAADAIN